jgi:hypothetical protein
MTKTVTLYGASDDLVELEGDISEEFNPRAERSAVLFSDGTALTIEYTEAGVWRIAPLAKGAATLSIEQAPADDDDNYSDRATLIGDIRWALFADGFEFVKANHTPAVSDAG